MTELRGILNPTFIFSLTDWKIEEKYLESHMEALFRLILLLK